MPHCPECGAEVEVGAPTCPSCGIFPGEFPAAAERPAGRPAPAPLHFKRDDPFSFLLVLAQTLVAFTTIVVIVLFAHGSIDLNAPEMEIGQEVFRRLYRAVWIAIVPSFLLGIWSLFLNKRYAWGAYMVRFVIMAVLMAAVVLIPGFLREPTPDRAPATSSTSAPSPNAMPSRLQAQLESIQEASRLRAELIEMQEMEADPGMDYEPALWGTEQERDDLADCLTSRGARLYGSGSQRRTQAQIAAFSSSSQYLDFVDCDLDAAECVGASLRSLPTWEIHGQRYSGNRHPSWLAETSGCLGGGTVFITPSD